MDNDDLFDDSDMYLLIREEYFDLFRNYKGKIRIIGFDYMKYKWSMIYKINFLKFLHSLKLSKCYNVTPCRGIRDDEISLLAGANEVYCLNSNCQYFKKAFKKKMDREYDGVLFKKITNEYNKHIELLKKFNFNKNKNITIKNKNSFKVSKQLPLFFTRKYFLERYIAIAPLASIPQKSWGLENYRLLCNKLCKNYKILLLGSANQQESLRFIENGNKNVINTAGMFKLNDIPSIIKNGILFIGNDSGLTHIALKLDVPLIAIIGGGSYGKFFPFDRENPNVVFLYYEMDCFGCEWKCFYKEMYCLKNVLVTDVLESIKKLLSNVYYST